jgi:integrase
MNYVYPLKEKKQAEQMIDFWFNVYQKETRPTYKKIAFRNAFMIELGIFCLGMRISDLRLVKVGDILGKAEFSFKEEKHNNKKDGSKNKKSNLVQTRQISDYYQKAIAGYVKKMGLKQSDYLFFSRQANPDGSNRPIGRVQAFNVIDEAGTKVGIEINCSCHTLRKTFAHLIYDRTKDLVFVQKLLGHQSPATTISYLGYDRQHEREVLGEFNSDTNRWS